jgi:hypothetical protein
MPKYKVGNLVLVKLSGGRPVEATAKAVLESWVRREKMFKRNKEVSMLDPRFRRLVRILTEGCTRARAYERLYAGHDA